MMLIVSGNGEITIEEQSLQIEYEITSGSVNSFTSDTNTTSLIINITATEGGSLKAILPRKIIDSKYEEQDDVFYLLIDGEEVKFTETTEDNQRTLTIPYEKESRQIEIIGTETINELVTIDEDLALATMIST
jgi:hypothetical protein|tara:strand:- start:3296 stop:3694 length:399 start_codon:yes stop_codon:yes gene_type:complete